MNGIESAILMGLQCNILRVASIQAPVHKEAAVIPVRYSIGCFGH